MVKRICILWGILPVSPVMKMYCYISDSLFLLFALSLSCSFYLNYEFCRLKANGGALTNFEVLDFLRSRGAGKDPTRLIASVAPSEYKVYDYLEQTAACNQTRDIIHEFLEKCKSYDLAKAEILNIINIRPSSQVEIDPVFHMEITFLFWTSWLKIKFYEIPLKLFIVHMCVKLWHFNCFRFAFCQFLLPYIIYISVA